jgi:hypothetical protein
MSTSAATATHRRLSRKRLVVALTDVVRDVAGEDGRLAQDDVVRVVLKLWDERYNAGYQAGRHGRGWRQRFEVSRSTFGEDSQ